MKKTRILIIAIILSGKFITGCEDSVNEMKISSLNEESVGNHSEISIEDGYLTFKSQEVFNEYFKNIESALNNNDNLKSSINIT